jgi:long-chain fatty acid transport protein
VGAEYGLLDGVLLLRAGYFFEASPAPDQPGKTNYIDADKHAFSVGVGLRLPDPSGVFPKPIELDLAGQWVHVVERRYEKDDPADPVGDYVASGRVLTVSGSMGFHF